MTHPLNRSESSRRFGLAFSLDLIDEYERDQLRIRELNPPHVRTPGEIRRECDAYRRDAHRVWDVPYPDGTGQADGPA